MNESHLGRIHAGISIFQYWHNTDLQHTLSLPSSPKHRPDHHHPIPVGKGKSWREVCVCLSCACQQCPRQQSVRFHTGTTILSGCGTRGTEETGKASKNWRGDYHLGLPMSRGIKDEKVSHLPQPSQNTLQCCCTKTVMKDSHPTAHR